MPFYEGRMIGQFDYSQKGWVSGKGRSAVWREMPWKHKQIQPQYLMDIATYTDTIESPNRPKLSHMRVGSSTNIRTAIGSFICGMPAGDTAATFYSSNLQTILALTAVINSLVFDFITRTRLIGLHLDYHVLEQNPLPIVSDIVTFRIIIDIGSRLNLASKWFSPQQLQLASESRKVTFPTSELCICDAERLRLLAILNSLVAEMYRLSYSDILRVTESCDLPAEVLRRRSSIRLDPKGFWRIDKDLDPEIRHTVLTRISHQKDR